MPDKIRTFSNFSRAIQSPAIHLRPENSTTILSLLNQYQHSGILARGQGLSYSDGCVYDNGALMDMQRFNHLLSFDEKTGIAVVQGAVTFNDLFLIHPDFIPPVVPGTVYATLAGGIANDVHGKNNPEAGTLSHHIEWLKLHVNKQILHCSWTENEALFKATLGGLGLTGVISEVAVRLRHAPRFIQKQQYRFTCFETLLQYMQTDGLSFNFQAAWLNLLGSSKAVLSTGNLIKDPSSLSWTKKKTSFIPAFPFRLLSKPLLHGFNWAYYHQIATTSIEIMPFVLFNNPLDLIPGWNNLYGKRGLVQFQAVFNALNAPRILSTIRDLIHAYKAIPTLAVLKYFTEEGQGLLSFPMPGFTIAIDFIHNENARRAITHLNGYITEQEGKIYLAKDLFLTPAQFKTMYKNHDLFIEIQRMYSSPMRSNLSQRLGLTP